MDRIEEPEEVDLVIAGGSFSREDRALLSAIIKRQRAALRGGRVVRRPGKPSIQKRTSKRQSTKAK